MRSYNARLRTAKNRLWKKVSEYVRRKDSIHDMCECISCGTTSHYKEMHAGHYISAGTSSVLRFDLRNIFPQCAGCNLYKSGNLLHYRRNLVKKFSELYVKKLEDIGLSHQTKKWNLGEIEEKEKEIDDLLRLTI